MDTLEFLQHVLPSEGTYASIVIDDPKRPRQRFYDTIEELSDSCVALSSQGSNVYYAVASFNDKQGGRKQDNVCKIKAFYHDIDCGYDEVRGEWKPFADWKAGLVGLKEFLAKTNLPAPMIVRSGNGIHAYWVLDRDYTPDEWKPVANRFKQLSIKTGFTVDNSVPADSARVLRAINTINPKGGHKVTLLMQADVITLDDMDAAITASGVAVAPARVSTHTQKPVSSLLDAMRVRHEFPPADPEVVASKCAQIKWATTNQKDVTEPMWYSVIGIAAFCENPEEVAKQWSEQHPSYDETETVRKVNQWKNKATGPTLCSHFETERPDGCKGCIFKDKISSPVKLSVKHVAVEVADDAPDDVAAQVEVPWPFKRTATGMKQTINDVDTDVCKFDIYPVGYGRDEVLGYETVRYKWQRPHAGWQSLTFRQAYLTDGSREFAGAIADQGIVLDNKKQTESFQRMLRSYMDNLRQMRSMTNLYASMGWKDDHSQFLLGDTIYKRDASGVVTSETVTFASQTQRVVEPMFVTKGTAEDWTAFTALLEQAKLYPHMFALCVSMSAVLYEFTGLKGLTVNLYGPTGSGKTIAQLLQQSVWGDPSKLHYTANFTTNALYSRMGLYNNLPVTIDETTIMQSKDVGTFLYSVSQGHEKARLTRTAEERPSKTWSTVVTTSSNRSFTSMLMAAGLETDAQMARLLEVTVYPSRLFSGSSDAGKMIHDFLMGHHGAIGHKIIEFLVAMTEDEIRAMISEHKEVFKKKYGTEFTGSERYWEQCVFLADLMGKIGLEQGFIRFDYTKGTEFVLNQMGAMRKTIVENSTDSFDLITDYINIHSGQTVTVMHTGPNKPQADLTRLPRSEMHIRFDLYRQTITDPFDRGVVLFDRRHFRTWLATRGGDFRTVIRDITAAGVNATPQSEKSFLGKDTNIKLGQQYVVGISLNHDRLIGVLNDADAVATNSALTLLQGGVSHQP